MHTRIIILLVLMLLDILTGVIFAIKLKQFKSSKMRTGLFNKIAVIFTVIFSITIDNSNIININTFDFVSIYIYFMECSSIIENIKKLNKDAVPKGLENLIEKEKKENGV